jgi:hypothetical protein
MVAYSPRGCNAAEGMPRIRTSGDCELRCTERHSERRLRNQRASPSTTSKARSSCWVVSESRRPMTRRTRSCRKATILSVMICERSRSPFDGFASIVGRSGKFSWTSEEIGQTKTVVKFLNSSAWTITPGRGRPNSLGATISTMSPRFTSTHSSRRRLRSRHRWHRFQDAAPSTSLVDGGLLERSDPANRAPNAGRGAAPARGDARGARPFAGAGCEVNFCRSFSG